MRQGFAFLTLAAALSCAVVFMDSPFMGRLSVGSARAADLGIYRAAPAEGVDCESDVAKTFDSVWLGHFTGGYSHSLGPGEPIVLDWRDEKLCYPSRHACDSHMSVMRREFHRPEGYFTCLPIR